MAEKLTPDIILTTILAYFMVLILVSLFTGKNASNENFFLAGRKNPWFLVAIGMIGASLSGVTFISIPGVVGAGGANQSFSYMQMVFGYLLGYAVIANVLLPLYYRMNLISIYGYLESRFGYYSYKTGAAFFLISRVLGSALRLYLVAIVLHAFVFEQMGISLIFTIFVTIALIWIYTFRGGVKTIVWTDTLQAVFMVLAVILTIFFISKELMVSVFDLPEMIAQSGYSKLFFFEGGWDDPNNFFKQFISGALITIVMTGLDQDMMQKNLSCRNLGEAQKNMYTFSTILIFVNGLFLALGALLYIFAHAKGIEIPAKTDQLYPLIAFNHLPPWAGMIFILGLIAAAYSSADSALTALTTSVCVDFLDIEKRSGGEEEKKALRFRVHIIISLLLIAVIYLFSLLSNDAVISQLFKIAGYTYGPLLGLFSFGMFTKRKIYDNRAVWVCLLAPVISYFIDENSAMLFWGFKFGFLNIALNGLLTFLGLMIITKKE